MADIMGVKKWDMVRYTAGREEGLGVVLEVFENGFGSTTGFRLRRCKLYGYMGFYGLRRLSAL
jgi:hypothetical protein